MSKQGQTGFNLMFFKKGLWMGAGQMKVKAYSLCNLVALGKAKPSFIVSHPLRWVTLATPINISMRAKRAG
ncbi:MAG: hypothetical protein ABSA62_12315 [Methyloceanibacter sp.]|jgi:hypothetical protein